MNLSGVTNIVVNRKPASQVWVAGKKVWDINKTYYIPFVLNRNNLIINNLRAFNLYTWNQITVSDKNSTRTINVSQTSVQSVGSGAGALFYIAVNGLIFAEAPHLYLASSDGWEYEGDCNAAATSTFESLSPIVTELVGVDGSSPVDPSSILLTTNDGTLTLKEYVASSEITISWQVVCQYAGHALILDEGHSTVGPGQITNVPWGNGQPGRYVEIDPSYEGQTLVVGYYISGLPSNFENPYSNDMSFQVHAQSNNYAYVSLPSVSLYPLSSPLS